MGRVEAKLRSVVSWVVTFKILSILRVIVGVFYEIKEQRLTWRACLWPSHSSGFHAIQYTSYLQNLIAQAWISWKSLVTRTLHLRASSNFHTEGTFPIPLLILVKHVTGELHIMPLSVSEFLYPSLGASMKLCLYFLCFSFEWDTVWYIGCPQNCIASLYIFMFCWPCIILDNDQLDTLFYNMFIIILYMFQALYAHHQEVELYWCSIWYRHSQSVAVRCTGRPLTESDDTRCCINKIQPPDDEHIKLETCRGL